MGTTELKVKLMSLAAEGRIIRREEEKAKESYRWARRERVLLLNEDKARDSDEVRAAEEQERRSVATFWSLREHRKGVVGPAARAALLAYGFLRGRPYSAMEAPNTKRDEAWFDALDEACSNASRFGGELFHIDRWTAWRKAAKDYLEQAEKERAEAQARARASEEKELLAESA